MIDSDFFEDYFVVEIVADFFGDNYDYFCLKLPYLE